VARSVSVIDIDRGSLGHRGRAVRAHLKRGDIIVVRASPEIAALRDLLVDAMRSRHGDGLADEVAAWCGGGGAPQPATLAHFANLMLQVKRAFVVPALLADLVGEIGFAGPLSLECGAPRFNVPKDIEEAFLARDDIVDPAVLGKAGDDPTFHNMWVGEYFPHRDVGRPHLGFEVNAWCALRDVDAKSAIIFFPDAYRDPNVDRTHYRFDDDTDPADWGYGAPLRIPMRFGDILLFAGDHLHSSPSTTGDFSRLSWEIRIQERCFDDVGWYRLGFLNMSNFLPLDGAPATGAIDRARAVWETAGRRPVSPRQALEDGARTATGIQALNWMIQDLDLTCPVFEELLETMMRLPFAEDRFVWPHFFAQKAFPDSGLDERIQEHVIDHSENYYRLLMFGGFAQASGRAPLAERAFEKAIRAASHTKADTLTNAVNYLEVLKSGESGLLPMLYQITPEDTKEVVRLYRDRLVGKGCHGDSVELVAGTPYPFHMFKPQYPFCEFFPPIEKGDPSPMEGLRSLALRARTMARNGVIALAPMMPAAVHGYLTDRLRQFPAREVRVGENWLPF
jgi:hypothetical protein